MSISLQKYGISEEHFKCVICNEILSDPISTPCCGEVRDDYSTEINPNSAFAENVSPNG